MPDAPTSNAFTTREEWLAAFIVRSRDVFDALAYSVPTNVRASIGYTSRGGRGKRIGECHSVSASADATFEIFVTPALGCPFKIAEVVTHELVHATVGLEDGHGKAFKRCATDLGLGGKMTATIATDAWHSWADPIIADLGPLPHAALSLGGEKKQGTRMVKAKCPDCGFIFRTTSKWLAMVNWEPQCPDPECNGRVMRCEEG